MTKPVECYAILTLDGLDQICYSLASAKREVRDLKAMGFVEAQRVPFESEDAVYEYCAKRRIHA